jgi:hypothetical protein
LPEIDAQNEIMEGHNLVHQNGQAVLSPWSSVL